MCVFTDPELINMLGILIGSSMRSDTWREWQDAYDWNGAVQSMKITIPINRRVNPLEDDLDNHFWRSIPIPPDPNCPNNPRPTDPIPRELGPAVRWTREVLREQQKFIINNPAV